MNVKKCSEHYVEAMTSMPSSSNEQNKCILQELKQHEITLDQCFVALKDHQLVARAIVYENMHYLGYITIEQLTLEETMQFLNEVLSSLDKTVEWRTDLYSDKIHFDTIYDALHQRAFKEVHRRSFVIQTQDLILPPYTFRSIDHMDKETLLSLCMDVTETTFDTLIQYEVKKQGLRVYCEHFLQELMEDPNDYSLFHILYIADEPIGFVCVNRLSDTIGGIGYIGVKQIYQGHHYSSILLQKAIQSAYQHHIYKLIGDIDERNHAMCYNLLQTGFYEDCKQIIFLF